MLFVTAKYFYLLFPTINPQLVCGDRIVPLLCFLPRPDHKYNPFKRLQTITADPTLFRVLVVKKIFFVDKKKTWPI